MQATQSHMGSEPYLGVRICENETREMQETLSRSLPSFYRRAYRYLGNSADAEDAVQDALLSAYKHLDQFKGQAQMATWLTAIVTNSARMHLRKRPRQIHLSVDERFGEDEEYCVAERLADRGPSPEEECRESELHRHLMQLLPGALAIAAQGIPVARIGRYEHERSSAGYGSGRRNYKGPAGTGTGETYKAHAPGTYKDWFGSGLCCSANYGNGVAGIGSHAHIRTLYDGRWITVIHD